MECPLGWIFVAVVGLSIKNHHAWLSKFGGQKHGNYSMWVIANFILFLFFSFTFFTAVVIALFFLGMALSQMQMNSK